MSGIVFYLYSCPLGDPFFAVYTIHLCPRTPSAKEKMVRGKKRYGSSPLFYWLSIDLHAPLLVWRIELSVMMDLVVSVWVPCGGLPIMGALRSCVTRGPGVTPWWKSQGVGNAYVTLPVPYFFHHWFMDINVSKAIWHPLFSLIAPFRRGGCQYFKGAAGTPCRNFYF